MAKFNHSLGVIEVTESEQEYTFSGYRAASSLLQNFIAMDGTNPDNIRKNEENGRLSFTVKRSEIEEITSIERPNYIKSVMKDALKALEDGNDDLEHPEEKPIIATKPINEATEARAQPFVTSPTNNKYQTLVTAGDGKYLFSGFDNANSLLQQVYGHGMSPKVIETNSDEIRFEVTKAEVDKQINRDEPNYLTSILKDVQKVLEEPSQENLQPDQQKTKHGQASQKPEVGDQTQLG